MSTARQRPTNNGQKSGLSTPPPKKTHMAYLIANLEFVLLSMFSVENFPFLVAQTRKHALVGALDFQIPLAGKSRVVDP